jgi:lysophospholipase
MYVFTCIHYLRLFDSGFNIYTYDHQSQGMSGRWLLDNQLTWIHSFDDYVDDFTYFVTAFPKPNLPLYLVAHSMGGLIASIAMSRLPNLINRAVLMAPMLRNKCGTRALRYRLPLPQPLASWIARFAKYCGMCLHKT